MQYHHHGYVSHDPRVRDAAGTGIDRPAELPDEMDVLIVGAGPSGIVQAAQLTEFPDLNVRIIDSRPSRLEVGRADGLWSRAQETFQAFGFQERIYAEAQPLEDVCFWGPRPDDRSKIGRGVHVANQTGEVSEFPLLIVNQSRVIDYFAEYAAHGPGRIAIDYGWEFQELTVEEEGEYPVKCRLTDTEGHERVVRAKYVVGCDGGRSRVRESVGIKVNRDPAAHAWSVMDVLATTDFPDTRRHVGIQSDKEGSILQIPREGGFLVRYYVSLGDFDEANAAEIYATTPEQAIEQANKILPPYSLDVKLVTWYSVYVVRHTVAQTFDDVAGNPDVDRDPRVFVCGDACHTHSAKAGQGMNVSIQDGWNIAWKLGQVLTGRSAPSLLRTYNAERQKVAQDLIDFDKAYSTMLSKRPEETAASEMEEFYRSTIEFPAGVLTGYPQSTIVAGTEHQALATDVPVGRRFRTAKVDRIADAQKLEFGHQFRADGRWRLYAFADTDRTAVTELADWLENDAHSPIRTFTPKDADIDSVIEGKVIYQQPYTEIELPDIPSYFKPKVGPYALVDYEKAFSAIPGEDIFEARGISRDGAIVVVRPDMYVAGVWPLSAREELTEFFGQTLLPQDGTQA